MRRTATLALLLALVVSACDRGAEPDLTTTTTGASTESSPATAAPADSTTSAPPTTEAPAASTTTLPVKEIEDVEVQVATTADEGEILWVTIPAEDYTDRDLENFVVEQFDTEENLWELHVLDDAAAVDAARVPEADRTEEEQQLVDNHYLISLTEGNVITFHGPFESAGSFLIGS